MANAFIVAFAFKVFCQYVFVLERGKPEPVASITSQLFSVFSADGAQVQVPSCHSIYH